MELYRMLTNKIVSNETTKTILYKSGNMQVIVKIHRRIFKDLFLTSNPVFYNTYKYLKIFPFSMCLSNKHIYSFCYPVYFSNTQKATTCIQTYTFKIIKKISTSALYNVKLQTPKYWKLIFKNSSQNSKIFPIFSYCFSNALKYSFDLLTFVFKDFIPGQQLGIVTNSFSGE